MEEYGRNKENCAPSHEGVQLDVDETSHLIRISTDAIVAEMEVSLAHLNFSYNCIAGEPAMRTAPALLQDLLCPKHR